MLSEISTAELRHLLAQLRKAKSPAARMRLALRGYGLIRRLEPGQRRELIRHLGLEEAEKSISRWTPEEGEAVAATLVEGLHQLEADPSKIRSLVADLRRPERRRETLGRALTGLSAALLAGEEQGEFEADGVAAVPEPVAGRLPETSAASGRPEEDAPSSDVPPGSPDGGPTSPQVPGGEPEAAPEGRVTEVEKLSPPSLRVVRATDSTAAPPPARASAGQRSRVAELGRVSARLEGGRPKPTAAEVEKLRAEIAESTSVLHTLRLLRRQAGGLRKTSAADLETLLECFPCGWARRRALAFLLEAGCPQELEAALSLIEHLEPAVSRWWGLTSLAQRRDLTPEQRRRLLEAVPVAVWRRRLEGRLSRRLDP